MKSIEQFKTYFSSMTDPRLTNHNHRHLLSDILLLTVIAVICGADSWVAVEAFGKDRIDFLKTFLKLENGIPSHDTLGDLFARLEPGEFQACFIQWVQSLCKISNGDIVAIDGKTLRHSFRDNERHSAIHMVSAWAANAGMVLAQRKVDSKSNEITAVPSLLKALDLEGAVITTDAMHGQKSIVKLINQRGANYVIALKENQGRFHEKVKTIFEKAHELNMEAMVYDINDSLDAGHGRIEERRCTVLPLMYLHQFKKDWPGLQCFVKIESTRHLKHKIEKATPYYISSLPPQADRLNEAIRRHWSIENELHWVLDVCFNEDDSRVRVGNAAENFAVIRHIALNLLKMEKTAKVGIKIKRSKAAWNPQYLLKILGNVFF